MGTAVGSKVGDGISVAVAIGSGVNVGGTGVNVGGTGVSIGGVGAEITAQLNEIVINTNTRKTAPIDFFMTLSPFDLIAQDSA